MPSEASAAANGATLAPLPGPIEDFLTVAVRKHYGLRRALDGLSCVSMTRIRTLTRTAPLALMLLGFGPGCGLLIGNVKPVDEKSDQYGMADLSKENPKVWTRLTPAQEGADGRDPETTATEVPDMAFQSSKTAAVISINSSCRSGSAESKDLKALTNQLLFGISDISRRVEKDLAVQNTPALETTLQGRMNGNEIALRSVVLKRRACVYDLLYMAPPSNFAENEPEFNHFVASLRLK
jgi:hypothetical protein